MSQKANNSKKRTIHIFSDKLIPPKTVKMIEDIFRESNCPNESMFNSIDDFTDFDGNELIILGMPGAYHATIEV